VRVHELEIVAGARRRDRSAVRSSKGFYVRALARDLALALGTCGHLCALRRVRAKASAWAT